MKAIIVDDETYCTDVLSILLRKYCPEVEITGIFNDPVQAKEHIRISPPDVLFLDIEMPHLSGFELLRQVGVLDFKVIFTTAYDQYALKAFKFNAIDYLLKPIDKEELIAAINKVMHSVRLTAEKLSFIQYLRQNPVPERVMLPIGNELIFVTVDNILCCEADGSYCNVYCKDVSKPYLLSKNLREMEEMLNNSAFFRPHASWLVNIKHIQKVIKGEGMELVVGRDIFVPVARSKKQEVMERLQK